MALKSKVLDDHGNTDAGRFYGEKGGKDIMDVCVSEGLLRPRLGNEGRPVATVTR